MIDSARLLAAYDSQLRTDAETTRAVSVTRQGPLLLATLASSSGFITYRDLGGAGTETIGRLVGEALAHFQANPAITAVEWKTRAHDHAPGLHEALLANGFIPDEPESIMLGEAKALAVDVALPDGVTLRRVTAGIYRALTAQRARSALRLGKTFINSDSTECSRPILERPGFVRVSTTTPYNWKRPDGAGGQ